MGNNMEELPLLLNSLIFLSSHNKLNYKQLCKSLAKILNQTTTTDCIPKTTNAFPDDSNFVAANTAIILAIKNNCRAEIVQVVTTNRQRHTEQCQTETDHARRVRTVKFPKAWSQTISGATEDDVTVSTRSNRKYDFVLNYCFECF